jgi:hypothetical protein
MLARSVPWCALILSLSLVGCGPSLPPGARPTHPVSVTVTYNGEAVDGATVTFLSQDGDPVAAYGRTDARGVAQMKTYVEGDGAVLGPHKVLITKTKTTGGGQDTGQSLEEYDPAELSSDYTPPEVNYLVPQRFGSPATSDLTAEVTSGINEFRFDLED